MMSDDTMYDDPENMPYGERIKAYSLAQLLDAESHLDRDAYPDRYDLLTAEINHRPPRPVQLEQQQFVPEPKAERGYPRHWMLTVWLWVMIAAGAGALAAPLALRAMIEQAMPGLQAWLFPATMVLALVNVVGVIAVFRWRTWGFWGMVGSAILALGVNIAAGLDIATSIIAPVGVGILYVVLQRGGVSNGWSRLH